MNREIFQALFLNAALLLAMTQVLAVSARGLGGDKHFAWKLAVGLLVGAIGIGVMSFALVLRQGLVFDVRSVLLSLCGLFFGFLPTVIAMLMTALFRWYQGGVGVVGGISVIIASAVIGIAWRTHAHGRLARIDWRELYALGLAVHLVMLGIMGTVLPGDLGPQTLRSIGVPILLIYPVATIALGLLLRLRLQQQAAARALRASEARYRSLFENKHSVMLLVDPATGEIVDANPAAAEYYGWTRDQLCKMKIFDINPMSDAALAAEMQLARAEERRFFNFQHRLADGSLRDVEVSSGPIRLEGRELLYSIVNDVTARKQAELRLRETRDKLAFAMRSSRIAHWEINLLDQTIERSFDHDQIFGYGVNQPAWTRETFMSHVVAEDQDATEALFQRVARERADFTHELRIRRVDGAVRWLWLAGKHLEPIAGQPPRMAGVVQDVTERREREEELARHRNHLEELVAQRTADLAAARQQAESANRAKSAFLANMSHEIRTPLNAIIGLTYLLRQREENAAQREKLDKIDQAGRHLLAVVNDMLDLSKIEAGRMELGSELFNLPALVDNVAAIICEEASEKRLEVCVDYDPIPQWLEGDPTRVRQALLNYAANAVKFTDKGKIHLRVRVVAHDCNVLTVLFEVEDTGVGIPEHKLGELFRSFEQADNSISRRFGGTGLGLSITRHLAVLMGGDAGVESIEGRGSRFWFTAQLRVGGTAMTSPEQEMPAAEAQNFLRRRYAGTRILVVDDNAVNREITVQLLTAVGLVADTAEDGQEAIDAASRMGYAVILMDVQMPRMDGLEATRLLRAMPGQQGVPILAVTANAFAEDRKACEEAGMSDVITKPVKPDVLYEKVLKWLAMVPLGEGKPAPPEGAVPEGNAGLHASMQRLSVLPGVDLDRILGIFRNKQERYLELLEEMLTVTEDDLAHGENAVEARDWAGAAARAHRIKGAAGNMGLELLQAPARDLEQLCKHQATTGDLPDARLGEMRVAFAALHRGISELRAVMKTG
ncbi:PAS domain S-box protein [Thioalkalivibrio sp. XN279]|uniref:PAS domain S-box protein n=1 Tax=Thioalkalivibrio sp. XN279 TaxID=2714953 RepID=UPI00140927BF|nr:PAS domain S-box protein [Thioalkalivibrio sp. XN279]NHA14483.1 PAS domain S-box protein [Thioalkalivibrio sp. XN279]